MMMLALAGLSAGAAHALSGPDHVAAVLPLASDAPGRGVHIGLSWASGHGLGTLALAAAAGLLRVGFDLESIGSHAELLVGVALVATGLWTLLRGNAHSHAPASAGTAAGIGTLHGIAGGSHLVVASSALALPFLSAASWLLAFVLGAGVAMTGIGWAVQRAGRSLAPPAWDQARRLSGVLAIGVGLVWMGMQLV